MDFSKMLDKILKNQYFTIRHLQNLKTLSADVLSKYELHTPLPRCDWLMQHIKLCVGELTAGRDWVPSMKCGSVIYARVYIARIGSTFWDPTEKNSSFPLHPVDFRSYA